MSKAYIVKKIYKGRLAICCYLDEYAYSEDYFSWVLYCDYNNTEKLFNIIMKLSKYNIEFIEEE